MRLVWRGMLVVAAALVVGAGITVGVGLLCGRDMDETGWSGAYVGEWPAGRLRGWPETALLAMRGDEHRREVAAWPAYEGWDPSVRPDGEPSQWVMESGWPWIALRTTAARPAGEWAGLETAGRAEGTWRLRPVWPGFAYGTLLFGGFALVVTAWLTLVWWMLGTWAVTLVSAQRRREVVARWRAACLVQCSAGGDARAQHGGRSARARMGEAVAVGWWLSARSAWKWLVALVVGAAAMGVMTTVLVAWGCALWPREMLFLGFSNPTPVERVGATFDGEYVAGPRGQMFAPGMAVGWPWRSMRWTGANAAAGRWGLAGPGGPLGAGAWQDSGVWREGIELPVTWRSAPGRAERRVPVRPVWVGLAGGVALWGAVWFVLLVMLGQLRRGLRARRGACPACGYPVGPPERCTECGGRFAEMANSKFANSKFGEEA